MEQARDHVGKRRIGLSLVADLVIRGNAERCLGDGDGLGQGNGRMHGGSTGSMNGQVGGTCLLELHGGSGHRGDEITRPSGVEGGHLGCSENPIIDTQVVKNTLE